MCAVDEISEMDHLKQKIKRFKIQYVDSYSAYHTNLDICKNNKMAEVFRNFFSVYLRTYFLRTYV